MNYQRELPKDKDYSDERSKIYRFLREANEENAGEEDVYVKKPVRSWARKKENGTYERIKGCGVPRMQYGTHLNEYGGFRCITTGTYRWKVDISKNGVYLYYSPGWNVDDTLSGWTVNDEDNG